MEHDTVKPDDPRTSPVALLRHRNFRLLWTAQGISRLGDQFYLIALPWLVLQVTGSALAMGTVLALEGIPRALFMLIGGAITDRFSPRAVILASYLSRLVVVGSLTVLVAFSTVAPWMIYVAAFLFGLADAFHFPAQSAIVPQGITKDHLDIANMLSQGSSQLSMFVGPVLAGAIIALVRGRGTGLAMAIDAASFAIAAWLLTLMRVDSPAHDPAEEKPDRMLASIRAGLSYIWHDPTLRSFVLLFTAANVLVDAPFDVGIPVLAHSRFREGAAAFGIVASSLGAGLLIGTILGGVLPRPPLRRLGSRLLFVIGILGVSTALLGLAPTTWVAAGVAVVVGGTNGYVVIVFITWVQRQTPEPMMGRMMSVLMMVSLGLNPLANAVAGAVAGLNVTALLVGSGVVLTAIVLLSALNPATRSLESNELRHLEELTA